MKKVLLFISCLSGVFISMGQSVNDAQQMMYYEKYNSAANLLHSILKNDASDVKAWSLLTDAYIHQNKVSEIDDSLKSAPADVRNDPLFNVTLGSVLLQKKSAAKAWTYFDNAVKETKGKNPDVLFAIAKANIDAESGDVQKAIELLEKAIKKAKHKEVIYTALGDAWYKLHNASEAYKAYQSAIKENNQFAVPMYKLGLIFAAQKNPDLYLKFFNQAIGVDHQFAPVYYRLYFHYYFKNVNTAMEYLQKYIATADHTLKMDYDNTDLLYLTKKYDDAIREAKKLIQKEKGKVQPRLYKLIAYSYKESGDTTNALPYMKKYFEKAPDSMYVVKDFATMADIYSANSNMTDSAIYFYSKAANMEKDTIKLAGYYKKLADLSGKQKKYSDQAKWLGFYYTLSPNVTNIDLFNWGIADYLAGEYAKSDTVFALYSEKYPDQNYGYYWRARSNSAIDTNMSIGLAVPHYQKLIELFEKDTATNKAIRKVMIEAYGYLAAYESNTKKDYQQAIVYFEKLLALDPDNSEAKKYVDILKKNLEKEESVSGS